MLTPARFAVSFRRFSFVAFAFTLLASGGAGMASAQGILLSPSPIAFADQPTGTAGNSWFVSVNNMTASAVSLGTVALSDVSNFRQTNNCPSSLAAYSQCNVQVAFAPSRQGNIEGRLLIPNGDAASAQFIPLSGNGTAPASSMTTVTAMLAPASINFGQQMVHTSVNHWTANLSNTGSSDLLISSIVLSDPADFSYTTECGAVLAGYSSCRIYITFTPGTPGPITGTLRVNDNAAAGPQTVALNGEGTAAVSSVTFAPASIDFGTLAVGSTGNVWTVNVSNNGDGATALSAFTLVPATDFIRNSSCGSVLPAHSSCTVDVQLKPATAGAKDAQLNFSADGTAKSIALHGTGQTVAPSVTVSPASVDFSTVAASSTRSYTLNVSNNGDMSARFSQALAISGSSAFTMDNTCPATIQAHSSCNIVVSFAPGTSDSYTGQMSGRVEGAPEDTIVTLAGTGTGSTDGVLLVSPSSVDLGSVDVGDTRTWFVNVSNTAGFPLVFSSPIAVAGSAAFTITTDCDTKLAAYSSCGITVSFAPQGNGAVGAQIVLNPVGGSQQIVTLSGTGQHGKEIAEPVVVTIDPGTWDFGKLKVEDSDIVELKIINESKRDAIFTSGVALTGSSAFSIVKTNCEKYIAAGSECVAVVQFAPRSGGTFTGEIVVSVEGLEKPVTAAVNGVGIGRESAELTPSETSHDFGKVKVEGESKPFEFSITNTGSVDAKIGALTLSDEKDYILKTDCSDTGLASGEACRGVVYFVPRSSGTKEATLTFEVGNGRPLVLQLSGVGVGGGDVQLVATDGLDFGVLASGDTQTLEARLVNKGADTARLDAFAARKPFSVVKTTCSGELAPGVDCAFVVTFAPTTGGSFDSSIVFSANGGSSVATTLLHGAAKDTAAAEPAYDISVDPGTLTLLSGEMGYARFRVTPKNGFVGKVEFACAGLPNGATCKFSPSSVAMDGSGAEQIATLEVATTGINSNVKRAAVERGPGGISRGLVLALFPAGLIVLYRTRRQYAIAPTLLAALAVILLNAAMGCGSGFGSTITPAGRSVVSVTATTTATTAAASSLKAATFTLIIKE